MVEAVLEAVSEGQLMKLFINLHHIPLTIDTVLLSGAVTRVQNCVISGGKIAQKQAVLLAVAESQDLALNTLRLWDGNGNVSLISADISARAAVKLNTFQDFNISTAQPDHAGKL